MNIIGTIDKNLNIDFEIIVLILYFLILITMMMYKNVLVLRKFMLKYL